MTTNNPVSVWKSGDPITAVKLNQPVNAINSQLPIQTVDPNLQIQVGPHGTNIALAASGKYATKLIFRGKIMSTGTSDGVCSMFTGDFGDNRYWVQKVVPDQQPCEVGMSNIQQWDLDPSGTTYVVENLEEAVSKTHFLIPGEIVQVYQVSTWQSVEVGKPVWPRYIMVETPKSFWGIISAPPYGADPLTDQMYYVQRQIIGNTGEAWSSLISWTAITDPASPTCDPCVSETDDKMDNRHAFVCAENLAENGTHNLAEGILVHLDWSVGPDKIPRYTFSETSNCPCDYLPTIKSDTETFECQNTILFTGNYFEVSSDKEGDCTADPPVAPGTATVRLCTTTMTVVTAVSCTSEGGLSVTTQDVVVLVSC